MEADGRKGGLLMVDVKAPIGIDDSDLSSMPKGEQGKPGYVKLECDHCGSEEVEFLCPSTDLYSCKACYEKQWGPWPK